MYVCECVYVYMYVCISVCMLSISQAVSALMTRKHAQTSCQVGHPMVYALGSLALLREMCVFMYNMYVCMYVRTYVCMYVCIIYNVYIYIHTLYITYLTSDTCVSFLQQPPFDDHPLALGKQRP
jgi:hypothetical protein